MRRDKYLISFSKKLNEITNTNAHSKSFSFLNNEPDLYSKEGLKKKYN